jgi:prepilin-type N-terminal cleavage/methylation domain-containing protein
VIDGRLGKRARAGFTLIELAAVVLVIALLYAFVLPNLGIGRRRALEGEAEGLRAGLELARQRAIATGARQRLAIDLDREQYRLETFEVPEAPAPAERDPREPIDLAAPRPAEGSFLPIRARLGRMQQLPDGITFDEIETEDGVQRTGLVGVEFFQDGSATAAVIGIGSNDGEGLELEVLPLADTVRVHVVR